MEFQDRLDAIWNRISSREFLENKGGQMKSDTMSLTMKPVMSKSCVRK